MFFNNQWILFATAYQLDNGFILFFRYNGTNRFAVKVFDGT